MSDIESNCPENISNRDELTAFEQKKIMVSLSNR